MLTLSVIVGISRYAHSGIFSTLPGAERDARRVYEALRSWGIPKQHLLLLQNEQATRANVLLAFRRLAKTLEADARFRLMFFFSGHGARLQGIARESMLVAYDTDEADALSTGISLADLVRAMATNSPEELYLFIDACGTRLDTVPNVFPEALAERDLFRRTLAKCFFCFVASDAAYALEHKKRRVGFFTESVLAAFAAIRKKPGVTIGELAGVVEADLIARDYPRPIAYHYGSPNSWPLVNLPVSRQSKPSIRDQYVPRPEALLSFTDTLLQCRGRILWIHGASGSGKSILIQEWLKEVTFSIYWSPQRGSTTSIQMLEQIASASAQQLPSLFPAGKPLRGDPILTLQSTQDAPEAVVLVLDHINRLTTSDIKAVLDALQSINLQLVLISQNVPPREIHDVLLWRIPALSLKEVRAFRRTFGSVSSLESSALLTASGGLPLELRRLLTRKTEETHHKRDLTHALDALRLTGGFLNARLYEKAFNIKGEAIEQLMDLGLICPTSEYYRAHDSIASQPFDSFPEKLRGQAFCYWESEVLHTPHSAYACRALLLGFRKDPTYPWSHLSITLALDRMAKCNENSLIATIARMAIRATNIHPLIRISAADNLVRLSQRGIVTKLLARIDRNSLTEKERYHLSLIQAEKQIWYGGFRQGERLIRELPFANLPPVARCRAYLLLGISHFFLGEWKASKLALCQRALSNTRDIRMAGWRQMLLGTIDGLRGIATQSSIEQLRSAIRLLAGDGDIVGAAIASNNLGELFWKTGDFAQSLLCLKAAEADAKVAGDLPCQLEVARNKVQLWLRWRGALSDETKDAEDTCLRLCKIVPDPTEHMQVWNTLATLYACRCDIARLRSSIKRAERYTRKNKEYDIYTFANRALLAGLETREGESVACWKKALRLCCEGGNTLARKQIISDIHMVQKRATRDKATAEIFLTLVAIEMRGGATRPVVT